MICQYFAKQYNAGLRSRIDTCHSQRRCREAPPSAAVMPRIAEGSAVGAALFNQDDQTLM